MAQLMVRGCGLLRNLSWLGLGLGLRFSPFNFGVSNRATRRRRMSGTVTGSGRTRGASVRRKGDALTIAHFKLGFRWWLVSVAAEAQSTLRIVGDA